VIGSAPGAARSSCTSSASTSRRANPLTDDLGLEVLGVHEGEQPPAALRVDGELDQLVSLERVLGRTLREVGVRFADLLRQRRDGQQLVASRAVLPLHAKHRGITGEVRVQHRPVGSLAVAGVAPREAEGPVLATGAEDLVGRIAVAVVTGAEAPRGKIARCDLNHPAQRSRAVEGRRRAAQHGDRSDQRRVEERGRHARASLAGDAHVRDQVGHALAGNAADGEDLKQSALAVLGNPRYLADQIGERRGRAGDLFGVEHRGARAERGGDTLAERGADLHLLVPRGFGVRRARSGIRLCGGFFSGRRKRRHEHDHHQHDRLQHRHPYQQNSASDPATGSQILHSHILNAEAPSLM
jgi:hypothetical protein